MVQKRKSTAIRKQQIIEAARKLIIKKGSEHLTVRAIASVVNITEAAIYRHFKSKREILSFLMTHITDDMLQELESQSETNSHSLETVNAVLKQHLSEIEQRRGMSFQIIAEIISLGDKKLNREVLRKAQPLHRPLEGTSMRGGQAGLHSGRHRPRRGRPAAFRHDPGPGEHLGARQLQLRPVRQIRRPLGYL